MKVWFDQDCEMVLSMIKDLGSDCGDMYCNTCPYLINEVTRHKQDGCKVVYIPEEWIKTIHLKKRINNIVMDVTVEDLEKIFLEQKVPPNFAYGLARVIELEHTVVRPEVVN